jgi:hypothetical protein
MSVRDFFSAVTVNIYYAYGDVLRVIVVISVAFEGLTAVTVESTVIWDVTPCSPHVSGERTVSICRIEEL